MIELPPSIDILDTYEKWYNYIVFRKIFCQVASSNIYVCMQFILGMVCIACTFTVKKVEEGLLLGYVLLKIAILWYSELQFYFRIHQMTWMLSWPYMAMRTSVIKIIHVIFDVSLDIDGICLNSSVVG